MPPPTLLAVKTIEPPSRLNPLVNEFWLVNCTEPEPVFFSGEVAAAVSSGAEMTRSVGASPAALMVEPSGIVNEVPVPLI